MFRLKRMPSDVIQFEFIFSIFRQWKRILMMMLMMMGIPTEMICAPSKWGRQTWMDEWMDECMRLYWLDILTNDSVSIKITSIWWWCPRIDANNIQWKVLPIWIIYILHVVHGTTGTPVRRTSPFRILIFRIFFVFVLSSVYFWMFIFTFACGRNLER